MDCVGSYKDQIKFTSNMTIPSSGDWGTIKFRNPISNIKTLNRLIIEYGTIGITVDTPKLKICNSTFQFNKKGISNTENIGGGLFLSNCSVINNNEGINLDASYQVKILSSLISENLENGLYLIGSGSWNTRIIDNSTISNNGQGMFVTGTTIHNSQIVNNYGRGIYSHAEVIIERCKISHNNGTGVGEDWYYHNTRINRNFSRFRSYLSGYP